MQARANNNTINVGILSKRAKRAVQIRWQQHRARKQESTCAPSHAAVVPPPTHLSSYPAAEPGQPVPLLSLPPDPSGNAVAAQGTPSDVFPGLRPAEPSNGGCSLGGMSLSEDLSAGVHSGAEDLPSEVLDASRPDANHPQFGASLDPGMRMGISPASPSSDGSYSGGPLVDESCSDESSSDEFCSGGSSSDGDVCTTTPAQYPYDSRRLALAPVMDIPLSVPRRDAQGRGRVPRIGRGATVRKVTRGP